MISQTSRQNLLIFFLGLGLLLMMAVSIWKRFSNPDLVISGFSQTQSSMSAMDGGEMQRIGELMRAAATNPGDKAVLQELVERMMGIGQWEGAENFAQKALALDPPDAPDPRSLHLLAIIHHNGGRNEQAAELLEKLLEKDENPQARYSLGLLYLHFLNQPERGIEQLRKGLEIPYISQSLRDALTEELTKAEAASESDGEKFADHQETEPQEQKADKN